MLREGSDLGEGVFFVSMMLFVLVLCSASGRTVLVRCLRHTQTTGCVFSQYPAARRLGVQHTLCRSIGSSLSDGVAIFTSRLCFSVPLDLLGWRVRIPVPCHALQLNDMSTAGSAS